VKHLVRLLPPLALGAATAPVAEARPTCNGRPATIVGSAAGDVITAPKGPM
jgi:hypothetical protein